MLTEKITVVGAGHVGATVAQYCAQDQLAREIVLIDVVEGMPQGKGLDLTQAGPVRLTDTRVVGANDYGVTEGSGIVVVTAGLARKPGMSRDDLQEMNASIIEGITEHVVRHSPGAILIIVTNPLDVMAYAAWKRSGFPRERVIGMAGILDTARYRGFIADALQVSVEDIQAMVLGGHGDSMVPLPAFTSVAGIPLPQLLPRSEIKAIVQRARVGGGEIVSLLKTGSAYYAPAAAVAQMVTAIVRDKKRILPCAAYLDGEYGIRDTFLGVPCKLGRGGLEQIYEIDLDVEDLEALRRSADEVKEQIAKLKVG